MQTLPRTPEEWVTLARSGPRPDQAPAMVKVIYRLWLVAFTLKMLGSTWDMSWHFKWLRDTAAPPHILNTVGTVMVVALVLYQARFSVGVDKLAKRLMVLGTAIFLIAIPIDILNHEINGLDITAWSLSHALLYLGTALMLLGCARGYWISTPPGRIRTIVSAALWGFFLENVLFPSQHQEYGTLSLEAWRNGTPTAEHDLLKFAADQIGRPIDDVAVQGFALPVDSWVYPAWMAGAALLTLVAARHFIGARFTATAIAGGYLAYRAVAWLMLTGTAFPPSLPPFFLFAGAVAIDLVFLAFAYTRSKDLIPSDRPSSATIAPSVTTRASGPGLTAAAAAAVFGAALATGAVAAAAWLQGIVIGTPPIYWPAFAYGAIALAVCWLTLTLTTRKHA
ncbi:hypothetical protein Rhe02_80010 [Rhizocola hellebori]|uniref:Uncharacterized protein n=1 Tax=Rhizocola hellebori TaxID=1392758 RepID=A0A8J3QHT9_9ACTN|nr:hypothetical protein [Rhizocola hellebori]GIH09934.1 hypothetical protein Rhe02_80010 [Rhizocola hellebori]